MLSDAYAPDYQPTEFFTLRSDEYSGDSDGPAHTAASTFTEERAPTCADDEPGGDVVTDIDPVA